MKKFYDFIHKYMFIIIIILVGIAYILTGASNIIETGETIKSIIASSLLGTILGWLISSLFGKQAIQDAFNSTDFISAINILAKEIESVDKDNDKLDIYCDIENEQTMIRKRTKILKRANIKYEDYANNLLDYSKLTKYQKKQVNKANKIGYGYLSRDWLSSDIEEQEEKDDKPINLVNYQIKKDTSNLFTKIVTGIISGYYVIEPFANMNKNIIIWRLFFFALWLVFGYVRYMGDYNFVVREYRKQIVKKTNELIKFKNSLNNHPEWYIKEQPKPIIETASKKDELSIINENKNNLLKEEDKLQDELNIKGELANEQLPKLYI